MIDNLSPFDLLKICATLASLVTVFVLRRRFLKMIGALFTGDDVRKYRGMSESDLLKTIDQKLDEIIKKE